MSFSKHHGNYLSHTRLWNAFSLSPTHVAYTHFYSSPHTWLHPSSSASAGSLSLWLGWSAQREQAQQSDSTPTLNTKRRQSAVYRFCTDAVCVEEFLGLLSTHLLSGWTLPVFLSLVSFPTAPTTAGGKTPPGREASVEALRWLGVQRGNGNERQRKKGLPHSSTFTPCCWCCCWLPLLSLHLPSPPHQDGPVSPWRGNQTCRQQRATKG